MKINKDIQKKIEETFDVVDTIKQVQVSPFLKEKTMQRMFVEKEERQIVWSWFTPKLQIATIVVVVVLNILAFTQLDLNTISEDTIEDFAETYELSNEDESTLFY